MTTSALTPRAAERNGPRERWVRANSCRSGCHEHLWIFTLARNLHDPARGSGLNERAAHDESLNLVGGLYAARGRLAAAERVFQRSLGIARNELGDHPDVADLLNNLGALHDIQGDYQTAEVLYEQALAIRVKMFGPDHPDLVIAHRNLARLRRQANPAGAEAAPRP